MHGTAGVVAIFPFLVKERLSTNESRQLIVNAALSSVKYSKIDDRSIGTARYCDRL